MFKNVKADIKRYIGEYQGTLKAKKMIYLCFNQEFLTLLIFRYGKSVRNVKIPVIAFLLRASYFIFNKIVAEICAGILLDLDSEIGKGFQIGHFGGVYIKVKIGNNCTIAQQVVIGYKGGFSGSGVPVLGSNVYVGAGAKVLGEIKIGNNVKIGANAVVINDVPDNATVVGVPARVVRVGNAKIAENVK